MTTMYWLAFALGGAVGAMGRVGIAATLTAGAGFPAHFRTPARCLFAVNSRPSERDPKHVRH